MKTFTLDCLDCNARHTRFRVMDHRRVNCGELTVLTEDAQSFVADNWKGNVRWNGFAPAILMAKVEIVTGRTLL